MSSEQNWRAGLGFQHNNDGFDGRGGADGARWRWMSFGIALCVHGFALFGLVSLISPRFSEPPERKSEPRIVAVAARIVPPPPDVELFGPEDVVMAQPRFRPRAPMMVREQRKGDPALAVWKYLCNRDGALSVAAQRGCPEFQFGDVNLGLLDPLNRSGDSGVLLGADTKTMTLEEAAVARGWARRPAAKGQSALAGKTDTAGQPRGPELFDMLPTLKHPIEAAPDVR